MVQHLSRNLHNRVFCPYLRAAWRLLSKKTRFLTIGASWSKLSTVNHQPLTLFKLTSCIILKNRQDACSTRKFTLCGTSRKACS